MAFSRYLHSSEEPGETGSESPSPLPRGPRRTRQGSLFPGQVRAGPALSQLPFLTVHPSSPESHQPPAPSRVLPSALDPNPAWPSPSSESSRTASPLGSAPRTAPQKPLYKTRTLSLSILLPEPPCQQTGRLGVLPPSLELDLWATIHPHDERSWTR